MVWTLWITGLPGSGKSTITTALSKILRRHGFLFDILRIDELRRIVTPQPCYSEEEREIIYSALVYSALKLTKNRINVIIDATGNRVKYREKARSLLSPFIEVYVRCPLNVCIEREQSRTASYYAPKNIYAKAEKEHNTVPGIGVPYEEPLKPDIIIDSSKKNPSKSAQIIFSFIQRNYSKDL